MHVCPDRAWLPLRTGLASVFFLTQTFRFWRSILTSPPQRCTGLSTFSDFLVGTVLFYPLKLCLCFSQIWARRWLTFLSCVPNFLYAFMIVVVWEMAMLTVLNLLFNLTQIQDRLYKNSALQAFFGAVQSFKSVCFLNTSYEFCIGAMKCGSLIAVRLTAGWCLELTVNCAE